MSEHTEPKTLTERRSIVFSPLLLAELQQVARDHDVTRSEFVRKCVRFVLRNQLILVVLAESDNGNS